MKSILRFLADWWSPLAILLFGWIFFALAVLISDPEPIECDVWGCYACSRDSDCAAKFGGDGGPEVVP